MRFVKQYKGGVRAKRDTTLLGSSLTARQAKVQRELEKRITAICEKYMDGMSLRRIAGIHKVSHESVRQILINHGIPIRGKGSGGGRGIVTDFGQTRLSGGYVDIYVGRGYPGANKDGWMKEHRYVMQEKVGRPLSVWEIVHHKDRNKTNNDINNLELTTVTDHATCKGCPYYQYYIENTGNKFFQEYPSKNLDKMEGL